MWGGVQPAARRGPGLPHRQAVLAAGTHLWVLAPSVSTRGLLQPPTGSLQSDGVWAAVGNDPILSSSPAPCLSSRAGRVDGSNTKRGPGALSSELHPSAPAVLLEELSSLGGALAAAPALSLAVPAV